jgi:short-subunit dehydrogenase
MTSTALITGASSGIGRDLAFEHAARGGDVVLVARREDKLQAIAAELIDRHEVEAVAIACDLANPVSAPRLHQDITSRGIEIDILINNAGFGGLGRFTEIDPARHEAMIQLNVLALTQLTRAYLPEMIARGRGRIMNVASTAAFVPGPLQAVYFATKAYVLSLTEALAVELEGTGVTVTALCPGATSTEFAERAGAQRLKFFQEGTATSTDVAGFGYEQMLAGKTVAVHGTRNRMLPRLVRLLPRSVPPKLVRRMQEQT